MSDILLTVDQIQKQYNTVKAIDGLSFHVNKGEIFALLGPNGAGKTTTVRILNNIILPDQGSIAFSINGNTSNQLSANKIGYLPEERGLYPDLKILYTLTYFGMLHGMKKADAAEAGKKWLDKMGLLDRASEKLDSLSKGNQQKVQFIASILHKPKFAVLDEPFSGLDPVNQEFFLDLITDLRDQGMTILLSAHQMQMVERIADRLLLINHGQEILHGTLDEIRSTQDVEKRITVKTQGENNLDESIFKDRIQNGENGTIRILVKKEESLNDILNHISKQLTIVDIKSEDLSLHDLFIRTVKKQEGAGE